MSKFCGACGAAMEDNAAFCPNCGAGNVAVAQAPEAAVAAKPKFNVKLLIVAAVAVVGIIALFSLLFSKPYLKPINDSFDVTIYGKGKKIEKLAPKEYWEYMEEEADISVKDFIENYEDNFDNIADSLEDEYGKRIKVKLKVTDKKKLSDKKLDAIAEYLDDHYDIESVKKAYELEYEYTVKGSEDKETIESEMTVVKIGSRWYGIFYNYVDGEVVYCNFVGGTLANIA